MAIFIDGEKVLNLPEQVEQNHLDIKNLAAAQDDDHDAINTNTNDINAMKTQIESVESIALKGDEANNKAQLYRSNKADMGSVQFKTINGEKIVGEGDIPVATSEGTVQTTGDQEISGVKTFKDPLHTNQIANENGGALVRFKETENASVYGGVNSKTVLMGSGDRPTYSKDGADFNGKEVALSEDLDAKQDKLVDGINIKTINNESILGSGNIPLCTQANWDFLMDNLGIGRWANQSFYDTLWDERSVFYDDMMPYYTNFTRFMSNSYWEYRDTGTKYQANMKFDKDFPDVYCNYNYAFYGIDMKTIELPNMKSHNFYFAFSNSTLERVMIKDGCNVICNNLSFSFYNCPNLVEIGAIDLSGCYIIDYFIYSSLKVKSIHCTHFKVSFDISPSTAFEEADLVEIISNLDLVSTTQTLTMGATNLAKLTNEEILVATGKGWQLA